MSDELETKIAALIAEHVGVGYPLGEDGHFDPSKIKIYAQGAAHVVIHTLRQEWDVPHSSRRGREP